ncbi:hypothetical protein EJB10_02505 [Wolbachia endosymbiont of Brugia malayi]|uniref:hypothetical protein n=1 Tax=Wolbachia endosymbiont of Brugia malayi TaxID=80849 RepID=UPI00004C926C|nr:hypothetical protein [Wolbachia endosymbiont of Brugia malayi]AAW70683.1 Predicted protein [Wolbachia endosymbiont strain TRS of Brugia malayi]QCB61666.1 hypothetical protein EJB10_02505 [Wolbachia endosymbiont of Brugia malayi]
MGAYNTAPKDLRLIVFLGHLTINNFIILYSIVSIIRNFMSIDKKLKILPNKVLIIVTLVPKDTEKMLQDDKNSKFIMLIY